MNIPALLGLIGSGLLAIPAFRQERRRRLFSKLNEAIKDPEDRKHVLPAAERHLFRESIRWNAWD